MFRLLTNLENLAANVILDNNQFTSVSNEVAVYTINQPKSKYIVFKDNKKERMQIVRSLLVCNLVTPFKRIGSQFNELKCNSKE